MKNIFSILILLSFIQVHGQSSFSWQNKKSLNKNVNSERFYAIEKDINSDIKWVLSEYGLYKVFDMDSVVSHFDKDNSPLNFYCQNMSIDKNGHIWVGGYGELHKYDGQKWITYNSTKDNFLNGKIVDIEFDTQGNVWFAVSNGGIVKYDSKIFSSITTSNSNIINNSPLDIAFDSKETLWIVSSENTLSYLKNGTFTNFVEMEKDVPFPALKKITFDTLGNVIIGTFFSGFVILNNQNETFTNIKPDIDNSIITHLAKEENTIWASTYKGNLLRLRNNQWQNTFANSIVESQKAQFNSFIFDSKEKIWLTSLNNGLFSLEFSDSSINTNIDYPRIEGSFEKQETLIYPNPSSGDFINIQIQNDIESPILISLTNISGQKVKEMYYPQYSKGNRIQMGLLDVSAGLYFVICLSKEYVSINKLIIVK